MNNDRMPHPPSVFPALLTLLLVTPVFAQTPTPAPVNPPVPAAPRMADTVTVLKPVHVDADRSKAPGRESATTVRLDRSQIVRFQPMSTADALLSAPGVDLTRTGPWASRVSVRGLSGERVLVLVDGVRLQSGRGHGAQTSLVSVDRLEGVEVMPGAGGAQSGSDALAGVVSLSTHRDLLTAARATKLMVSSRFSGPGDEWSSLARVRFTGPRIGAEFAGGLGGLSALVTPDGRMPHSSHHEQEITGRAAARLGTSTLDYEHQRHAAYAIGLPAFNSNAGSLGTYPLQSRDLDRLEWSQPLAGRVPEMRVLAVQQRFCTDFDETTADSQYFRGRYIALRTTDAADRITTWSRGVQPTVRFGLVKFDGEYRHESTAGPRSTDVTVATTTGQITSQTSTQGQSVPPARRDVWAGGAVSSIARYGMRLDLGARYEWLRSRAESTATSFTSSLDVTDHYWTDEAGLSRPIGPFTPYARVASGFRSPNLEERYFNDEIHGGLRLFGNPLLRAEKSVTYEGGIRALDAFGGYLGEARVSAYRSDVRDLVTLKYIGQLYLIPRFQYTNVNRARLEGIEGHFVFRCSQARLSMDAAAPRGYDMATGKPVTDLGAARATFELRTPAPRWVHLKDAQVALRGRWTDASGKGDPNLSRASFWTADAEMGFTLHEARITATVRNLTDTRYREPLSFIPEAGRSFAFAIRREFPLLQPHTPGKEAR
jgi:hemoglobin/transferrin/lactoferrin receptor protein